MNIAAVAPHSWNRYIPPLYLLLITVAELLATYAPPVIGMTLHALLLVALLAHTALTADAPLRALLLALCIAPLIRILSYGLPLARFPQLSWYFIVSVPLFIASVLLIRTLGFTPRQIGLRIGKPGIEFTVALIGLLLGLIEYLILRPEPLIAALAWQQLILPALILLVCTGFVEELIFRGVMQQAAYPVLGRWAIAYVAAIFAVLHIGYQSLIDLLFVFVVGLLFGYIVVRTGSLLGVTIAHGLTNIVLFLVAPFLDLPTVSLVPPAVSLPDWVVRLLIPLLWLTLLVAGAGVLFQQRRRRRRFREAASVQRWVAAAGNLLRAAATDPAQLESLAKTLRERLDPEYLLVIERSAVRQKCSVTLALGITGRRLYGVEGLAISWAVFEDTIRRAMPHAGLFETAHHPFSWRPGHHLILPLADGQRWLLLRSRSGEEQTARSVLQSILTV